MAQQLAINGGEKTIVSDFAPYNSIGEAEVRAATAVVESGVLSKYLGCWELPDFFGGEKVQQLESEWAAYFGTKYAVSVNSNTSGLIAALGAIGLEPGDEVIVSTWTMCASATSILIWNAIPVFADIEDQTFNIDPPSIEKQISAQTKAIVVPSIFGHPAAFDEILAIAKKHSLAIVEDAAQVPGARYHGKYAGTLGDIGVFSLNYHKHIHTGEGGICVTDSDELAERMQLIRNHAEASVADKGVSNLANMIGFNFRMTEIEAAIGSEQLKKLAFLVGDRQAAAERLTAGLASLPGLQTPIVRENCSHVYYMYPLLLDEELLGLKRDRIFEALQAEGVPGLCSAYINVHQYPMYQQKQAYGSNGFPWSAEFCKREVSYEKGICPVAESLQESRYMAIELCLHEFSESETSLVIAAFKKVWKNLDELK